MSLSLLPMLRLFAAYLSRQASCAQAAGRRGQYGESESGAVGE